MIIYLIRHGETDWNKAFRVQGQADIPLNNRGRELAESTAEALQHIPFEKIFSSPLGRALETARILRGDRSIPIETDNRLKEINFGVCEGMVAPPGDACPEESPLSSFWKQPDTYFPPENGESFEALYARSADFLREKVLPLEHQLDTLLIAGHGALNRSILNPIAGIPLSDFWQIRLPNCAVSILSLQDGRLSLRESGRIYY